MASGRGEKDWKIDVCLLDINMPEMDGLSALKRQPRIKDSKKRGVLLLFKHNAAVINFFYKVVSGAGHN